MLSYEAVVFSLVGTSVTDKEGSYLVTRCRETTKGAKFGTSDPFGLHLLNFYR